MFEWWHLARDGLLARATFQKKMRPLMREVERLLAEAADVCPKKVAGTARQILKLKDALWTFVYTEGVEPTNNSAERDFRHAVLWRKTSLGTQREQGSRFAERIPTWPVLAWRTLEERLQSWAAEHALLLLQAARCRREGFADFGSDRMAD